MVKYKCDICMKEFLKKCDYNYHTQKKKKPCKIEDKETIKIEDKEIKNKKWDNNYCNYCRLIFSRKDALTRHMKGRCNVKRLEEEKKEDIFNKLIEKEMNFETIMKDFRNLEKDNTKLKKQIKRFENKLNEQTKKYDEKIKNVISKNITKNINNNLIQNIIIPTNRLIKFGEEDLGKIDNNNFLKVMNGNNVTGCKIFIEILKLIHFNEKYPEYQNIYMTDKNREHYMIYNGRNWELNKNSINKILYQIENIFIIKLEELEEANKNQNFKYIIEKIIKSKNLYFDDEEERKKERHDEFIKSVDERIKNYLYNNKEIPINNYTKLTNNLLIKNN